MPASPTPPLDPLSPEATHTVIPISAAAWKAWSSAAMAWGVHDASGPPQLIEITEGLLLSSWIAVETASKKPASVLGAK
jgi:hypothetical protein